MARDKVRVSEKCQRERAAGNGGIVGPVVVTENDGQEERGQNCAMVRTAARKNRVCLARRIDSGGKEVASENLSWGRIG